MKKIGLTGVMGAGKSSVIQILKDAGITVLDCDVINAQLQTVGEQGYLALVHAFSEDILDAEKQLDKKKMSDLIFSNPKRKLEAEAILHPLIKARVDDEIKQHENELLVVVEVPLLFEVKWETFFDEIWVVASDEQILLSRLQQFRQVSEQEAKRRLQHQMSQEEKIQKANVVLWNNDDLTHLKEQIYAILNTEK